MHPKHPTHITTGLHLLYQEDVFVKNNENFEHAGIRKVACTVLGADIKGFFLVKIIKSKGFNAFAPGTTIKKPTGNLMRAQILSDDHLSKLNFKSGGHLAGIDPATGKQVTLDNADRGGMGVGAPHSGGGIKAEVGSEKRPIEFEGQEPVIVAGVSSNQKTYDFNGKKMTGHQILSSINVDNGGVDFAVGGETGTERDPLEFKGGEIILTKSVSTNDKTYEMNGKKMTGKQIASQINQDNGGVGF